MIVDSARINAGAGDDEVDYLRWRNFFRTGSDLDRDNIHLGNNTLVVVGTLSLVRIGIARIASSVEDSELQLQQLVAGITIHILRSSGLRRVHVADAIE